jgi:hypothetical protein
MVRGAVKGGWGSDCRTSRLSGVEKEADSTSRRLTYHRRVKELRSLKGSLVSLRRQEAPGDEVRVKAQIVLGQQGWCRTLCANEGGDKLS